MYERRQRVVPEPEALDRARGDGDDVLQRAADLHARDVFTAVEPECRPLQLILHECRGYRVVGRHNNRCRETRATSTAKLGPDSTATASPVSRLLAHNLRHPGEGSLLQSFRRADDDSTLRVAAAIAPMLAAARTPCDGMADDY